MPSLLDRGVSESGGVTTIADIQASVVFVYSLRSSDMQSSVRSRRISRPRQVAMYLSRELTRRSFPEIGRQFGNRDHTTVMHAVERVRALMNSDEEFRVAVLAIRRGLEAVAVEVATPRRAARSPGFSMFGGRFR